MLAFDILTSLVSVIWLEHFKSSDRNVMRRDITCRRLNTKRRRLEGFQKSNTHLSIIPSVFPTSPGPVNAPHCNIDIVALSHGMRISRSSRLEAQDQTFIFRMGCFNGGWSLGIVSTFVMLGDSIPSFEFAEPVIFFVDIVREGRDDDEAMVIMINRIAVNAKNTDWRTSQHDFCIDSPIVQVFVFPQVISTFLESKTSELDVSRQAWPFDFGRLAWTTSTIFVIPSQSSHGSDAFPPIPPPSIISENIWPTSVVRQSFSKSSVGSRTAKSPSTSNCLYAASLSIWDWTSGLFLGLGTGESAGNGQIEWYICRGSDSNGGGFSLWCAALCAIECCQYNGHSEQARSVNQQTSKMGFQKIR